MKKLFFPIVIILLIATSCQKHLERNDAREMIVKSKNYPIKYNYEITKAYIKDMHTSGRGVSIVLGEDEMKKEEKNIERFVSLGLLTLVKTPQREETTAFLIGTTIRTWTSVDVELTKIGKEYLVQEKSGVYVVNLWEIDFQEITGIQEMSEQKVASVDYTIANKNITPFGSIFSDKNNVSHGTAYFSLYDDGWRIQE